MRKWTIVLGLLAGSCMASCGEESPAGGEAATTTTTASDLDYIRVDSANRMIQSYLTSLVDTPGLINLQSLIVDAKTLRAYLSDTSIKELKIMLAHTLSYINAGNEGQHAGYAANALTVVLGGYNAAGNYVTAAGVKVPDHARPCPTNCPGEGSAASPLFPTNP
jgi:hypothetical protein